MPTKRPPTRRKAPSRQRPEWSLPDQCLSCGYGPDPYVERTVDSVHEIKGEEVSCSVAKWFCRHCNTSFLSPSQADQAVRRGVEAYQMLHGLMTAKEIKAKREEHGWSQSVLADNANLGVASIKRWESGALVQTKANDDSLRRALSGDGRSGELNFFWVGDPLFEIVTNACVANLGTADCSSKHYSDPKHFCPAA